MAASHLNRLTREHALLMTCACAAVLLLSFPSTIGNWTSLNLSSVNSSPNESEIDSAARRRNHRHGCADWPHTRVGEFATCLRSSFDARLDHETVYRIGSSARRID